VAVLLLPVGNNHHHTLLHCSLLFVLMSRLISVVRNVWSWFLRPETLSIMLYDFIKVIFGLCILFVCNINTYSYVTGDVLVRRRDIRLNYVYCIKLFLTVRYFYIGL
jgi:hypothetical protein